MAYRSKREETTVDAPETGFVADMVRQFADPYAFARELVQNSIDAGATGIEVTASYGVDGRGLLAVRDDGGGMTREDIEGPLLTLFNSSKDEDSTKIGKYGVGFVSVFALQPEEVTVATWRGEQSWLLRLFPDHSYELEQVKGRPQSGTVVTLVKAMSAKSFAQHSADARASLLRWCRHARVPIHYRIWSASSRADEATESMERIDRPLDVQAAVVVEAELDSGRVVMGPSAGAELLAPPEAEADASEQPEQQSDSFAGFYNRGLTLYETTHAPERELRRIRFKVDSSALEHTLSRDNVRHDESYERVLAQVVQLAKGELRAELQRGLQEAAQAVAAGADGSEVARSAALLTAACQPPLELEPDELALPLANPAGSAAVMTLEQLLDVGDDEILATALPNELTATLAAKGRPVVYAAHDAMVTSLPARSDPVLLRRVDEEFLLASQLAADALGDSDRQLCEATLAGLQAAGARVAEVILGTSTGATPPRGAIALDASAADADVHLRSTHQAASWWTRWGEPPALLLLDGTTAVSLARRQAELEPRAAGNLLARALLVEERGALGKSMADGLLDAACEAMSGRAAP